MKIEHLIVQHLFKNRSVTLQDIGTFHLAADAPLPDESNAGYTLPENAVRFEFDKKAKQDDALIDFIVTQTRKIKPLASSDLESYSILAKQFLNIGKPFPIEGLGVLQKNQEGIYEFTQGNYVHAKLEAAPALLKEKAENEISFSATTSPREKQKSKSWLLIGILLLLFITAGVLYYFFKKSNKDSGTEPVVIDNITVDSIPHNNPDTTIKLQAVPADSSKPLTTAVKTDSFNFKIVLKEYPNKLLAEKAYNKLTSYGHKLLIYPKDSTVYKIAMPFMNPLSDTTRMRDSLRRFFQGNPYVEITTP